METSSRTVLVIAITEKHLSYMFGLFLNAVFLMFCSMSMLENYSKHLERKELKPVKLLALKLPPRTQSFAVPQASSRGVGIPGKGSLASIDSLLSMVKNTKPGAKIQTTQNVKTAPELLGDKNKLESMMKDVKLSDDFMKQLSKDHQGDNTINEKILNKAKIVMANNISYFKMCYDKVLLTDNSIDGALPTTFLLNKSGAVSDVSFGGSITEKASGKEMKECFLGVGKKMVFPKEFAGESLKYTFNLQK
jgi:hypothetical protein